MPETDFVRTDAARPSRIHRALRRDRVRRSELSKHSSGKHAKTKNTLPAWHPRNWPMSAGLALLRLTISVLPFRALLALGTLIGRLGYPVAWRRRHVAEVNLELCFPELSVSARTQRVRRHFEALGIQLFEIGLAWWGKRERLARLLHLEGCEHLAQAHAEGRGVLLLSCHMTYYEIVAALLSRRTFPSPPWPFTSRSRTRCWTAPPPAVARGTPDSSTVSTCARRGGALSQGGRRGLVRTRSERGARGSAGAVLWRAQIGQCFQVDGMQTLYPKLREADVWVLATPVHLDGMSGPMKNVLNRMVPLLDPRLEVRDGHSRHIVRPDHKWGKVVRVATCGLSEMDYFDPLIAHLRAACRNLGKEFAGAVLRPQSSGMLDTSAGVLDDVFAAAREAGHQLVRDGAMSPDTLAVVSRQILTNDAFIQHANFFLDMLLEQLGEPPATSAPTFGATSS